MSPGPCPQAGVAALAAAVAGWGLLVAAVAAGVWGMGRGQTSAVTAVIVTRGLWADCGTDASGVVSCVPLLSLVTLPGYLHGSRAWPLCRPGRSWGPCIPSHGGARTGGAAALLLLAGLSSAGSALWFGRSGILRPLRDGNPPIRAKGAGPERQRRRGSETCGELGATGNGAPMDVGEGPPVPPPRAVPWWGEGRGRGLPVWAGWAAPLLRPRETPRLLRALPPLPPHLPRLKRLRAGPGGAELLLGLSPAHAPIDYIIADDDVTDYVTDYVTRHRAGNQIQPVTPVTAALVALAWRWRRGRGGRAGRRALDPRSGRVLAVDRAWRDGDSRDTGTARCHRQTGDIGDTGTARCHQGDRDSKDSDIGTGQCHQGDSRDGDIGRARCHRGRGDTKDKDTGDTGTARCHRGDIGDRDKGRARCHPGQSDSGDRDNEDMRTARRGHQGHSGIVTGHGGIVTVTGRARRRGHPGDGGVGAKVAKVGVGDIIAARGDVIAGHSDVTVDLMGHVTSGVTESLDATPDATNGVTNDITMTNIPMDPMGRVAPGVTKCPDATSGDTNDVTTANIPMDLKGHTIPGAAECPGATPGATSGDTNDVTKPSSTTRDVPMDLTGQETPGVTEDPDATSDATSSDTNDATTPNIAMDLMGQETPGVTEDPDATSDATSGATNVTAAPTVPLDLLSLGDVPMDLTGYIIPGAAEGPDATSGAAAPGGDGDDVTGGYLLSGCDVFVTREPCALCAMALLHARVRRVFYGRPSAQGALGTRYGLHGHPRLNHRYRVWMVPQTGQTGNNGSDGNE
ncbi:probable inactive tRNA-specific adenosine deaminase-like protein 3 [Camarhynchus parvulus]|uniref:probable inactive tRNA-specific adenosine deaminase-like protein 3 n=1 Tax=Geospiza parvula TaxID=87175 RepID=UPI001237B7A5|nr:probable inactive tRNA-specific adenosine deaminase-like protein 3 [Camarhynchus parvulus]